ncbi:hypothetical protein KKF84_07525 [Myxococcota bacterium]|nr:hypothetical protein [Myxococcota bacterium]MBU1535154.1 hypothetical protein [Myxococcota bacterium]
MGDIKTTRFPKKGITVRTVRGIVSSEEIEKWISVQYAKPATPHLIWDMRKASVEKIHSRNIKDIFDHTQQFAEKRLGGKTALIVGDEAARGLSKLYTTHHELNGSDNEHRIFGDLNNALKWISEDNK